MLISWPNLSKKDKIEPSYQGMPRPSIIEILKLLPKTNCKECGAPTCLVFATQVADGAKGATNCPILEKKDKALLDSYMEQFQLGL